MFLLLYGSVLMGGLVLLFCSVLVEICVAAALPSLGGHGEDYLLVVLRCHMHQ